MNKEYLDIIDVLFKDNKIDERLHKILISEKLGPICNKALTDWAENPPKAYPNLKGSKLSVFLDWLFSDPARVMDYGTNCAGYRKR